MDNPFFRENMGLSKYEEETPAESYPFDLGGPIEGGPVNIGPSGPPQVGPVVDDTPLSQEEIQYQIDELNTLAPDEDDDVFMESLMTVENGVQEGWDGELWTPHKSIEGGSDTLAYGHKLTKREDKSGFVSIDGKRVNYKEGLSEEQAKQLLKQDVDKAKAGLTKNVSGFDALPGKYQNVLVNIAFNIGSGGVTDKKWPNLIKAMKRGDDMSVRKEMVTSWKDTNTGDWIPLQARADYIADSLML